MPDRAAYAPGPIGSAAITPSQIAGWDRPAPALLTAASNATAGSAVSRNSTETAKNWKTDSSTLESRPS